MVKKELLDILRCPHCIKNDLEGKLELFQNTWLLCTSCERKYPIIDDIPVMLLVEAEKWANINKEELPIPPKKAE